MFGKLSYGNGLESTLLNDFVASTWCPFVAPNLVLVLACSAAIRLTPPILVLESECPTLVTPMLQPPIPGLAEPTVEHTGQTTDFCCSIALAFRTMVARAPPLLIMGSALTLRESTGLSCITFTVHDRVFLSI